ncbi:hypothetical protein Tco_0104415 [Tanacetum coccineum]
MAITSERKRDSISNKDVAGFRTSPRGKLTQSVHICSSHRDSRGASDEELEGLIEGISTLSADASPTALSPSYIANFNPEEDEEDLRRSCEKTICQIDGDILMMSHLMMTTLMMVLRRMEGLRWRRSTSSRPPFLLYLQGFFMDHGCYYLISLHNMVSKQKSPEKERSTEKIVEEEAVTQEEREEVVKEPAAKRKKSIPRKTTRKRQKLEEDTEKDELKRFLDIVPREEAPIEIESLSTKFPIVDWKTVVLTETFMYYQVFRGDGSSKNYKILSEMLEDFDRMDVEQLFRLVKERYSSSAPEGFDLMLWGDLHTLFEHDADDEIWRDQHEYNLLSWRLCDFCGIHILLMDNGLAIHMLTEKKYPLSQEMLSKMLSTRLEVDHESSQAFELLRFIRAQVQK